MPGQHYTGLEAVVDAAREVGEPNEVCCPNMEAPIEGIPGRADEPDERLLPDMGV